MRSVLRCKSKGCLWPNHGDLFSTSVQGAFCRCLQSLHTERRFTRNCQQLRCPILTVILARSCLAAGSEMFDRLAKGNVSLHATLVQSGRVIIRLGLGRHTWGIIFLSTSPSRGTSQLASSAAPWSAAEGRQLGRSISSRLLLVATC